MEDLLFDILDACNDVSLHTNTENMKKINSIRNNAMALILAINGMTIKNKKEG